MDPKASVLYTHYTIAAYSHMMVAYSQTLALMNDVKMNDRVKMIEIKTVSRVKGPENRQELVQARLRRKGLFKKKGFEFRVKLMRGQG